MVPVTRVHDPCLVALFKQLPPADQMTARKVCRRWADLVTYAARSTRSLAILVGENSMKSFARTVNIDSLGSEKVVSLLQKEDGSPMFPLARFSKWNALQYHKGLDKATVEAIAATFVNLDALQICLDHVPWFQFDSISHLLELFHHRLTSLKVLYPFVGEKDSADRLFGAINRLSTLKQLQLGLGELPYHDLPIISKLEQLQVYWAGCSPLQFVAMLQDHVKVNSPLRCVKYLHDDTDNAIKQFTKLDDHLFARFTRFEPGWRSFTNSELICTKFRYLTSVNIQPTTTTLRRLFGHLSQLTQLLYLRLDMNFRSLLSDDQPHLLLPQLKSVKALQLSLTITSHSQLEQLKISWTMPNLQAIDLCHIWPFKCTDCTIEEFSGNHIQANLATFKRCYRQMLAPLKRTCTQIRAILHNHEDILGTAEELLAEPPVLRIVDWMKRRSTGG